MGQAAAIVATLELSKGKFKTQAEEVEQDLESMRATVTETAAAVAVLERALKEDSGNKALKDNLSTLKTSLRESQREMTLLEQQKRRLNSALGDNPEPRNNSPVRTGGGHGGDGNQRMAGMEAGHSIRSIVDMMGAGQNMGQALQMELPRMLQAAGAGIGTMIGIEMATAIARGLENAIQSKRVEAEKFGALLSGNGGGVATSSSSVLQSQIEALDKSREEMLDATGNGKAGNDGNIFSWISRQGKNLGRKMVDINAPTVEKEADDKMVALDAKRQLIAEELLKRKAAAVELDERASREGEDAVAIDKERLALRERIAAVTENKSLGGDVQAQLINLLKRESELREEHIQQALALKLVEDQARRGNAQDRTEGRDTGVTKAERALKEAQDKLSLMKGGTEQYKAGQDDVTNRTSDLRDARQQEALRDAQRRDAGSEAANTGTQVEKTRQRLQDRFKELSAQLDPTSKEFDYNDESRKNKLTERDQVSAELRGQDRADTQRGFERRRNLIAAETGVGTKDKLAAVDKNLSLNRQEQVDNNTHEKDVDRADKLSAQAAQLLREKKEIELASAKELANAVAATREMQLQQTGQSTAAQQVAIRAQYEERIAAALRDGKTDLADQLRLQQKMALAGSALAEFRKTPAQHLQDSLTAQKDERDLKAMEAKRKTDLARERQKYEDNHRTTLPLNAAERRAEIERKVPDTGSLYDGSTKAKESGSNAADLTFDQRFHGAPVPAPQPDRRAVATADPQQQHSQDDSNIGDVVDVLEDIKGILDERLDLTIP